MPLTFEPAKFYAITVRCNTADTEPDDGAQPCPNFERVWEADFVYSNAGQPQVWCGLCSKPTEFLEARLLDPQPDMG